MQNSKKIQFLFIALFAVSLTWLPFNQSLAAETAENPTQITEEVHSETTTDEHSEEPENSGIVGMFGLNWKLFLAQLVNFGIVLFVLWKWVFGPVTKGLSDRTSKIEASLKDAEKISKEREDFDSWKDGEIGDVRKQAAEILSQAKQDADQLKNNSLEQTKQEQQKIKEQAITEIEAEKQKAVQDVQEQLADIVVGATEKVLQNKLTDKDDKSLIEQAIKQAGDKV